MSIEHVSRFGHRQCRTPLHSSKGRCFTSPVIVAHYRIRSPHGSPEFIPSPSALPPRTPANYPTSVTPVTLFKIFLVAFGTFARVHSCRASAILRLRPLHQTGAQTGRLRKPIQLRPTLHIYPFVVSDGRADVRRIDSGAGFSNVQSDRTETAPCSLHGAHGFHGECTPWELDTQEP